MTDAHVDIDLANMVAIATAPTWNVVTVADSPAVVVGVPGPQGPPGPSGSPGVTKEYVDSHGVYLSPTPPADPDQWALWVDTS